MTIPTDVPAGSSPTSSFKVTHYMRPVDGSGWSQVEAAEVSSSEAINWIVQQAADAAALGFGDGPAVTPADPTPPAAAVSAEVPTATPTDGGPAVTDLGNS